MVVRIVKTVILKVKRSIYWFLLRIRGIVVPVKLSDWAIGYDDLLLIEREINRFVQRKEVNVLEFGSGTSTLAILAKLEKSFAGAYRFVSIEADQVWFDKVSCEVKHFYPNAGKVSLIKSHYVVKNGGYGFDLTQLREEAKGIFFDVILVDAPPDDHGENVRLDLCNEVIPMLHHKGVLILHDTNRINELFAVCNLSEKFYMCHSHQTEKGLTIFRFPRE